jgi:hypothetical protein
MRPATVHLLAGLNGVGKSTFARQLERDIPAVRFTLDEWVLRLYGLHYEHPDYAPSAEACKHLIWDTAQQVLATGVDVVLDWNQWSRHRRATWRDKALQAGHYPLLHYLPGSLETALARAEQRRRHGTQGAHVLDEAGIRHLARLFEIPAHDEGLELHVVDDPNR